MTNDTRACTRCRETKPLDKFGKDSHQPSGKKSECKECARARAKRYYEKSGRKKRGHKRQYIKHEPGVTKACQVCAAEFRTYSHEQKYCSRTCMGIDYRTPHPLPTGKNGKPGQIDIRTCTICQSLYPPKRVDNVTCSSECAAKARRIKEATKNNKRRKWADLTRAEPVDPQDIYQRDEWACGLCDESIDPGLKWPHPKSASIDHIRPLSWGGTHTADNLQAAHLECNWTKGARGELDAEAIAFQEKVSQLA